MSGVHRIGLLPGGKWRPGCQIESKPSSFHVRDYKLLANFPSKLKPLSFPALDLVKVLGNDPPRQGALLSI